MTQQEGLAHNATSMTGSELLFTAMGSQRILGGSSIRNKLKMFGGLDTPFLLRFTVGSGNEDGKNEFDSSNGSPNEEWYQKVMSVGWYSVCNYYVYCMNGVQFASRDC